MEWQMKVAAATVGCKVNFCDGEGILQKFADCGYEIVDFDQEADVYIVNTCTVTNASDHKSRQLIRKARAKSKRAIVAVVGCYSQLHPKDISDLGVDIIMGTNHKDKLAEYILKYRRFMGTMDLVSDVNVEDEFEPIFVDKFSGKTRAFLKIQDGCNNFCAYCIVPYARGKSRSRRMVEIKDQARIFAENGYKEIVICGIHIAGFGKDLKRNEDESAIGLLNAINIVQEIAGIERIRLSSLEPAIITPDFVNALKGFSKIMPHFHLPLQSGCDNTLNRMGRKYTTQHFADAVGLLKSAFSDCGISSDIIAGFPQETEEEAMQSLKFIKSLGLSNLHIFPYSAKEGTRAAKMDGQISPEIKKERVNQLLQLDREISQLFFNRFLGQTMPVLIERENKKGMLTGKTPNYIDVFCDGDIENIGKIIDLKLVNAENNGMVGEKV